MGTRGSLYRRVAPFPAVPVSRYQEMLSHAGAFPCAGPLRCCCPDRPGRSALHGFKSVESLPTLATSSIAKLERDVLPGITVATLQRFCETLSVSADYLLGLSEADTPTTEPIPLPL